MRAKPRRKNHTMGAKWLRRGSKSAVNFPGKKVVGGTEKVVTASDATDIYNPGKSGQRDDLL